MRRPLAVVVVFLLVFLATSAGAAPGRTNPAADPDPAEVRAPDPGEVIAFRVDGSGWGHGVGMSQHSARNRALAGQSAADILGFSYPGTTLGPDGAPVTSVRVRIARSVRTIRVVPTAKAAVFRGANRLAVVREAFTVSRGGGGYRVVTDSGRVLCEGRTLPRACGPRLWVRYTQGQDVTISSATGTHTYRWGRLRLTRVPGFGGFQGVLHKLSTERYLLGLGEVPSSWPAAALQAQAIAGRSFASSTIRARRAGTWWTRPWDIESGTTDQVYLGADLERNPFAQPWVAAVSATAGTVVRGASGNSVSTNYSSSNGGYTESGVYVFGTPSAWLVAQPDPFDAPNPTSSWSRTYTRAELRLWMIAAGMADPGRIERIVVTGDIGPSGRIDRADVVIRGRAGVFTISGNRFRQLVYFGVLAQGRPDRELLSTKFTISPLRAG